MVNNPNLKKPRIEGIEAIRRKALTFSKTSLIKTSYSHPDKPLPLIIEPAVERISPVDWAMNNRELVETYLLKHGGILFRNFNVKTPAEFEQFIKAISGDLLEYQYGSTPRSQVFGNIYTSTEYPADQPIPLHNEMSYSRNWPMKIFFFCLESAEQGGETPIADSRRVFKLLAPEIKQRFIEKRVMYVRNYSDGLDLHWRQVFQTDNKSEVEEYCRRAGIEFTWTGRDRLRTSQTCQAVASHPKTGEMVWFNQAHLFHVSNLKSEVQESFFASFQQEDLPRNTYYADGLPIEATVLDQIRNLYEQEAVIFPWEEGDVLMLDNMLTAHGRRPFAGSRRILVGMSQPYFNQEI